MLLDLFYKSFLSRFERCEESSQNICVIAVDIICVILVLKIPHNNFELSLLIELLFGNRREYLSYSLLVVAGHISKYIF